MIRSEQSPDGHARLIVIDSCDAAPLRAAAQQQAAGWLVLALGIGEAVVLRRCREELHALGRWRFVDVSAFADDALEAVHAFAVGQLAHVQDQETGHGTLAETLREAGGTLWWYLEVSERSSFRQPLLQQLYWIALVRRALAHHEGATLHVAVGDALLATALGQTEQARDSASADVGWTARDSWRYWSRASAAAIRLVANRFVAALLRGSEGESARDETVVFTPYPGPWWLRPFSSAPTNRFFSTLPRERAHFVVWLERPFEVLRHLRAAKATVRHQRLLPLQRHSRLRDLAPVLSPGRFRRTRAAARQARGVTLRFEGHDVRALFLSALHSSLIGGETPQDLLVAPAVRRFVESRAPRQVVYRCEFQPSEHAVLRGCDDRAQTVGFVHSPFGRNYLPMQFTPADIARHRAHRRPDVDRPMPDAFLTSGSAGLRHLVDVGVPAGLISECGPQRYLDLVRYLQTRQDVRSVRVRLGLPSDVAILFVATGVLEADNDTLLSALIEACTPLGAYRLVIKPHPNFPHGDAAIRSAIGTLGSERAGLLPPDTNMYDAMAAADGVLCTGSTLVFEAIALGVMPIAFENPGTFAATSVREFSDGLFVSRTAVELRRAIEHVLHNTPEAAERRSAWPSVLAAGIGDCSTPLQRQFDAALTRILDARVA